MSDPNQPQHHADQPPHYPPESGGGMGVPPAGPPPQGAPHWGPQPRPHQDPTGGLPVALTRDEVTWGSAAHWTALVASVVALAFLGPLIVMLTKGNESRYVRAQAVESLNFQLSILIYGIVSFVLAFVLIGFVLLPAVGLLWLICTIMGAVKASHGEVYRYPLTIRMVS